MTELKNDRYLRALLRQPVDVTPVWMMRQAGRYLPEYKATRAQAGDFMSLCKNAELACEVTLQPLRRYPLDAAILFSDILTVPDAMGLGLYFEAGEGPRFTSPITCKADVDKLPIPDPEDELGYVMNAVRTIRREQVTGRRPGRVKSVSGSKIFCPVVTSTGLLNNPMTVSEMAIPTISPPINFAAHFVPNFEPNFAA